MALIAAGVLIYFSPLADNSALYLSAYDGAARPAAAPRARRSPRSRRPRCRRPTIYIAFDLTACCRYFAGYLARKSAMHELYITLIKPLSLFPLHDGPEKMGAGYHYFRMPARPKPHGRPAQAYAPYVTMRGAARATAFFISATTTHSAGHISLQLQSSLSTQEAARSRLARRRSSS